MPDSSTSAVAFLPFGALMGVVPIDAMPQGRVLGEFGGILTGANHSSSKNRGAVQYSGRPEPVCAACAAWPPSPGARADGGI